MNNPVYPRCTVPAAEVARIKGLGFLRDKTTEDKFNCRVLTVNGRVSSDFMRNVAEAADKFGSGKLAMTSRMTVEIQGIPYSNVDDFIAYARNHPELTFLVTRIGCGIAGFKDEEVAPLFIGSLDLPNVHLPKSFFEVCATRCCSCNN